MSCCRCAKLFHESACAFAWRPQTREPAFAQTGDCAEPAREAVYPCGVCCRDAGGEGHNERTGTSARRVQLQQQQLCVSRTDYGSETRTGRSPPSRSTSRRRVSQRRRAARWRRRTCRGGGCSAGARAALLHNLERLPLHLVITSRGARMTLANIVLDARLVARCVIC